jgi:hypothetical protein
MGMRFDGPLMGSGHLRLRRRYPWEFKPIRWTGRTYMNNCLHRWING